MINLNIGGTTPGTPEGETNYLDSTVDFLSYTIQRNPDLSKSFLFVVVSCTYENPSYEAADPGGSFFVHSLAGDVGATSRVCKTLTSSQALNLAPVQSLMGIFLDESVNSVKHINYGLLPVPYAPPPEARDGGSVHPYAAIPRQASATSADPYVIFYDGLVSNMDKVDLTTFAILTQVPINVAFSGSPFGVRPSETGPDNEVWLASQLPPAITIVDMGAGSVVASIPTPALAAGDYAVNVVFTNDGAIGLEAVAYAKPDSSGNKGALLTFDAASRTLVSTLPLPNAPQEMLMAPDGLTAYLLGNQATITYYDILSGTADLTAPFTYFVSGLEFIHPDGTRLFCIGCVDGALDVFDLTTRQFTSSFNLNLAMHGAPASASMSQDGSTVTVTDNLNNIYIVDTRYGNLVATYQTSSYATSYPGAPE